MHFRSDVEQNDHLDARDLEVALRVTTLRLCARPCRNQTVRVGIARPDAKVGRGASPERETVIDE
jgi:hypothetical protein